MNAATLCPPEVELKGLLDGSLPEARTDELAAHMESCERCRREIDRLAAGGDWPAEVARQLSSPGSGGNGESVEARQLAERWRRRPAESESRFGDGLERLAFLESSDTPGVLGTLGPYEITETIGRGGFGLVLKGRDLRLNRVVAVKVLAPEWASNATARKRFLREAQAAAAVRHDHVVTIYAVDEVGQLPYLVMEFVPGKSLQERLDEQGPLDVREILRIGRQIALGLAAAHAEGLIHRDIKPGNVLLEDGIQRVKITDFGLARAVDDVGMTQTGTVAGTPEYMSPEQAWGGPVDHRTDLFSLGCVLYAMCTGRSPFRAGSAMAVLRRVCEDEPRPIQEINAEVPRPLAAVIARLLAKDPDDRYASASEVADLLAAQLAALQNAETIHMPPETPGEAVSRGAASSNPEARFPNWLIQPIEAVPLGTWTWLAESFQRANRWGRWREWGGGRRIQEPLAPRRVRWALMAKLLVALLFVVPIGIVMVLQTVESWQRDRRIRQSEATLAEIGAVLDEELAKEPPWSPPLAMTNELTLDVRDPNVQIAIDGQPYPVEGTGVRVVRLGEGQHQIAVADERGWFDKQEFYTPTSESYVRIDRGGIVQSTAPTNVQVQWIQSSTGVSDLRFKGPDAMLIGRDNTAVARLLAWEIDTGRGIAAPLGSATASASDSGAMSASSAAVAPDGMGPGFGTPVSPLPVENTQTMALTRDGDFLAVGTDSDDGKVRLLNVANPRASDWLRQMVVTQHPEGIHEVAFSPDGRLLICVSTGRTEVFRRDGLIVTEIGRIASPAAGGALKNVAVTAAFLPDGRRVLLGDKDGNLEIWDARTLRLEAAYPAARFGWGRFDSVDFDQPGRLALLNHGGKLSVFDVERGQVVSQPGRPDAGPMRIQSARFLPDGRHCVLVVTDPSGEFPELQVGDIETGRITARLDLNEGLRAGKEKVRCHDVRFSPDGRRITAACVMPVTPIHHIEQYNEYALAVVTWAVPDDAFQTTTPDDTDRGGIEQVGKIETTANVTSLDFIPDGTQFVTREGSAAVLRTFPDGDIIRRLAANFPVTPALVAVSPDGRRVAVVDETVLRAWDRVTGEMTVESTLSSTVKAQGQDVELVQGVLSVAWSPDGGSLLIACPRPLYQRGGKDQVLPTGYAFLVRLDGETAQVERRFEHRGDVNAAIFLGDGSRIATACSDGGMRIWSDTSGKLLHEHNSGGGPVVSLDATTDGGYIAAGLFDGSVRVWETRYGRPVLRLDSSGHPITAVRLLPDESRLVAADTIGVVTLWDLGNSSIIAQKVTETVVTGIAVHPDGEHILTAGSKSPAVTLWRLPPSTD